MNLINYRFYNVYIVHYVSRFTPRTAIAVRPNNIMYFTWTTQFVEGSFQKFELHFMNFKLLLL